MLSFMSIEMLHSLWADKIDSSESSSHLRDYPLSRLRISAVVVKINLLELLCLTQDCGISISMS